MLSILPNGKLNQAQTHIISDCVYCGKENHFFVYTDERRFGGHRCHKCGESGKLIKLLKFLRRTDLLVGVYEDVIKPVYIKPQYLDIQYDLYNPTIELPYDAKRVYENYYLDKERGFISTDYINFPVYVQKGKNEVLFPIYENYEIKGYSTRSTLSKSILEANGWLRWKHYPTGVNTSKLLYGLDNVENAKTAILVEGITDCISLYRKLELKTSGLCSVDTFGVKCSAMQAIKLLNAGVKNIILMYDNDSAVVTSIIKKLSYKLQDFFYKRVYIAVLTDKLDPDESSKEQLVYSLEHLKTPSEFNSNYI